MRKELKQWPFCGCDEDSVIIVEKSTVLPHVESDDIIEPRTLEDLWLMCKTSNAWFDGQLRYEDVRKGADPEVGMVDSVSWNIIQFSDCLKVRKHTYVICEVRPGKYSFSCRVESETVAEYQSMEEFRASEWWYLAMEKFAGGDTDASWLRTVELNGDQVRVQHAWIGHGPDVTLSVEVGNKYCDWLGSIRQGKGHSTLDVMVDRMSGTLSLQLDGHEVEGTVEEIESAMTLVERMSELGVKVGDDTITVPLPKKEGDK